MCLFIVFRSPCSYFEFDATKTFLKFGVALSLIIILIKVSASISAIKRASREDEGLIGQSSMI